LRSDRLAYQPTASSTSTQYFSLGTNQQPAPSTFLSEQISIRHQPNEQAVPFPKFEQRHISKRGFSFSNILEFLDQNCCNYPGADDACVNFFSPSTLFSS
jgi:hypothetical protein